MAAHGQVDHGEDVELDGRREDDEGHVDAEEHVARATIQVPLSEVNDAELSVV